MLNKKRSYGIFSKRGERLFTTDFEDIVLMQIELSHIKKVTLTFCILIST